MSSLRFASISDLGTAFSQMSQNEAVDAELALEEASALIRSAFRNRNLPVESADPDDLKLATVRMVRRVLQDSGEVPIPMGVESQQIGVGPFQRSFKYAGGSSGQVWIAKSEYELLGLNRQQVFSIDLLPDGWQVPK